MSYYYDGISYSYDEIKKRIEDELKNNIKNPDERSSLTLELVEGEKILSSFFDHNIDPIQIFSQLNNKILNVQ